MRYLLFLLIACCGFGAEDFPPGLSSTNPAQASLGLEPELGLNAPRTTTQAIAAAAFINLNDPALTTFTRTTSAWDPKNNAITYANQRRQRTFTINGTNYSADLIESARTCLLASGTSEHFERWTVGSGTPVVTTDTIACPNAEVVADTLTEGVGTGTQGVSQSITKAASSLAYVGSCYIKNKTGSREVAVDLDDGTLTNGVQMRINPATGALTAAPAAFGTGWAVNTAAGTGGYTITDAGSGWYRVSVIATSDTTTTVRFRVGLYNGSDSYAGDGTSAVYLWGADANQATFAAAVCLCRNLIVQSETLNTTWTKARSTITSDAVADPITGNITADKLVEDNTASSTHLLTQTVTKPASALSFTYSVYAKAGERSWIMVGCGLTNTFGNAAGAYFDLTNGATGSTVTVGSGWSLASKTITSAGNGWYRCCVTVASDTGATTAPMIQLATADGGRTYSGDGTSGAYLWGAHLEYGTTLTQYWATTTAGLRTADVLLSTLTGITDARTNRLTWSEQFDNAAWTKTDTTITANAGTDPNGNAYADLATEGTAGTAATSNTFTITANTTVAASIYLRASVANSWLRVKVGSDSGVNGYHCWYNIATGAVGTQLAFGTGTATSISITNAGNGWYRLLSTGKVDPAATTVRLSVLSAAADGSNTPVNSSAYYLFGAQGEQAATVGDYIPVGGTAITTGPTGLSRTTGTLVSIVMPRNWTGDQDGSTIYRLAQFTASAIDVNRNGATTIQVRRNDTAGSEAVVSMTAPFVSGALLSAAMTWSPSAVTGYVNGAAQGTPDSTLALPYDPVTSLGIGETATGTLAFFGYVLCLYSHQQVVPGSTLALIYAATTAP